MIRSRAVLAAGLSLSVMLAVGGPLSHPAIAAADACAAAAERPNAEQARAAARACEHRVEVLAERTAYSRTFAEADGTSTREIGLTSMAASAGTLVPPYVEGAAKWTIATSDNSAGNLTDTKIATGDPKPAASVVTTGFEPDYVGRRYRGFLEFPIADLAGAVVLGAKISGVADHTYWCSAKDSYLWRTGSITKTPQQTWPGPKLVTYLGAVHVTANEGSCAAPNKPFETTSAALINDLQAALNSATATYTVGATGVAADGSGESSVDHYMRFFVKDYKLTITYNHAPRTPDRLTVNDQPCGTGTDRPFVNTATPTLRAHVYDVNGDTMDTYFWWSRWNGSQFVDEPGSGVRQDSVPNNGTAMTAIAAADDGAVYAFRSRSDDSPSHPAYLTSPISVNCEWQVDLTPPGQPIVTSDTYPAGHSGGGVGITGRFTFTAASADTAYFLFGWDDPPTIRLTPDAVGGTAALDWAPTESGLHTLYAQAVDRAGNPSDPVVYPFTVPASAA
ncbi:hypothetical protein AB0H43_13175 [Hamadaea sp. NPDC050747]|uniref:hypothetical protein n=1 Tax=Hamadaea sp. NPDC050747 TaxID=3155789 RepID=UPI0033DECE0A